MSALVVFLRNPESCLREPNHWCRRRSLGFVQGASVFPSVTIPAGGAGLAFQTPNADLRREHGPSLSRSHVLAGLRVSTLASSSVRESVTQSDGSSSLRRAGDALDKVQRSQLPLSVTGPVGEAQVQVQAHGIALGHLPVVRASARSPACPLSMRVRTAARTRNTRGAHAMRTRCAHVCTRGANAVRTRGAHAVQTRCRHGADAVQTRCRHSADTAHTQCKHVSKLNRGLMFQLTKTWCCPGSVQCGSRGVGPVGVPTVVNAGVRWWPQLPGDSPKAAAG